MTPERKPVRAEGEQPAHCYCNHTEHAHPCSGECACKVFAPRPCICGHVHLGRCHECACRKPREDRTPEFILRQGIRTGEWGIAVIPRLQALMRPEIDPMWRIWACLNIRAMDRRGKARNRGRLVTILLADGKTTKPMAPNDVMAELNALDTVPRLDRHIVRKNLRELERLGWVRVVGRVRKNTRIFLYARPLKLRTLEPIDEPQGPDLGSESEDPNLGVQPDPQSKPKPSDIDYLQRVVIMPIRAALVKNFSRTIREELTDAGIGPEDLGVDSDPQTLIENAVDELLLGVQSAYQKLREGVQLAPQTAPPINKERARASSTSPVRQEPDPEPQRRRQSHSKKTTTKPLESDPAELLAVSEGMSRHCQGVDDQACVTLMRDCRKVVPDATLEEIVSVIHAKAKGIGPSTRSAIALLMKIVPQYFGSIQFKQYRESLAKERAERAV